MGPTLYQGFPRRLAHDTPGWVPRGATFHIRIRSRDTVLIDSSLAPRLLDSARQYHERNRWELVLMLLMPDHLHALLGFPNNDDMTRVVGDWKRFQRRYHGVQWQEGFFDHRLRNEIESVRQQTEYILANPVMKGLCKSAEHWPWTLALT